MYNVILNIKFEVNSFRYNRAMAFLRFLLKIDDNFAISSVNIYFKLIKPVLNNSKLLFT